MGKIMYKDRQYSSSFDKSVNILYDNSNSGLSATNVQAAIDELKAVSGSGGGGTGGNYLPLTGGTLTGAITVPYIELSRSGTPFIDFHYGGDAADYTARIAEYTKGKLTIESETSDTPLLLQSNEAASYIGFVNKDGGILGYFGVGSDKKPYFYDTGYRTILHSNNYSSYALPLSGGKCTGTVTMPALELSNDIPFIDFHFNGSTADYTSRIAEFSSGTLTVTGNLDVNGDVASTNGFFVYNPVTAATGTDYTANRIHTQAYSIFRISTTGNMDGVAIGENFRAASDKVMNLGNSSYKWKQLYAGTTTISTSDRNEKKDFRTFNSNENYEKFFMDLKPFVFKFKDGDSGRDHFGFVSQDVEDSLYKLGFNDKSFAGFCKDVLMHEVEDENGNEKEVPKLDENGNEQYIYGLRYSEFTALNTYMIQKTIKENQELKDKNEKLEAKNEELESRLQAIEKMLEKLNV